MQVQPAIANIRIEAYAVKNGKRYLLGKDAPDAGCDYVEIEEYYDIIDPLPWQTRCVKLVRKADIQSSLTLASERPLSTII